MDRIKVTYGLFWVLRDNVKFDNYNVLEETETDNDSYITVEVVNEMYSKNVAIIVRDYTKSLCAIRVLQHGGFLQLNKQSFDDIVDYMYNNELDKEF